MDVRAFGSWMSAPKCSFFQDFEGLTEVFAPRTSAGISAWTSAGYPAPKLTLWAAFSGQCEGSRLVGGTRLVVFPRFLTLHRPKHATSRDPYPPFEPGPLFRPGPLPPFCTSLGRGNGKGSRLERGSRLVAFLSCGRFGRGNTTSRVPQPAGTPCLS